MDEVSKDILNILIARNGFEDVQGMMDIRRGWYKQMGLSPFPPPDPYPSEKDIQDFIQKGVQSINYYVEMCATDGDTEVIVECRHKLTNIIRAAIHYQVGHVSFMGEWDLNYAPLFIYKSDNIEERYQRIDCFIQEKMDRFIPVPPKNTNIVLRGYTYMFSDPKKITINQYYKAVFPFERFEGYDEKDLGDLTRMVLSE